MSTRAFPALHPDNRTFVLALAALTMAVVTFAALDISAESYKRPILMVLLFVDLVVALRNWRLSVYLFVAYVLVEGFIINYFSGQRELNLLKDVQLAILFVLLCAGTLARQLSPFPRMAWLYALAAFGCFYSLTIFNPALPSIMVGLIGIRVTLVFALCVAIGYWFFRCNADIMKFLKYHALLSVPISLFGILQYFTGPGLLLSISPGFGRAIYYAQAPGVRFEDVRFRAISTFASTGGFSQFLWASAILTWAYFVVAPTRRQRLLALVALVLQLGGMLASGGRAPLIVGVISLFAGYALMRRFTRGLIAACLSAAFVTGVILMVGGPLAARFSAILDIEAANERNSALIVGQFKESMAAPVEGIGAGRLTAAASRWSESPAALGVENQLARIRYESGVVGLLLFVTAIGMVSVTSIRIALSLRDPMRRVVGGLVTGYLMTIVLIMPVGMPLDVPPANFYFWFLLGMLHSMARDEEAMNASLKDAQARMS